MPSGLLLRNGSNNTPRMVAATPAPSSRTQTRAASSTKRAETHGAAVRTVRFNHGVDGVANQVEAHLLNLHRIAAHRRQGRGAERHVDALAGRRRTRVRPPLQRAAR